MIDGLIQKYKKYIGITKDPKKLNGPKVTSYLMALGMLIYHYHWIKYGDIGQVSTLLTIDLSYLGFLMGTNVADKSLNKNTSTSK